MRGLPTKRKLSGMSQSLEQSIKKEVSAMRSDLSHLLVHVEDGGKMQDMHEEAIWELQDRVFHLSNSSLSHPL